MSEDSNMFEGLYKKLLTFFGHFIGNRIKNSGYRSMVSRLADLECKLEADSATPKEEIVDEVKHLLNKAKYSHRQLELINSVANATRISQDGLPDPWTEDWSENRIRAELLQNIQSICKFYLPLLGREGVSIQLKSIDNSSKRDYQLAEQVEISNKDFNNLNDNFPALPPFEDQAGTLVVSQGLERILEDSWKDPDKGDGEIIATVHTDEHRGDYLGVEVMHKTTTPQENEHRLRIQSLRFVQDIERLFMVTRDDNQFVETVQPTIENDQCIARWRYYFDELLE